jgi:hypothetical protein
MEMNTFQFAEEFIEEFFMEFEPQFMMEPEGMQLEEGPIVMFTDDVMMEEIYEETEELVATFLPMVPEEEKFSSEESFVQSDGPIFMEPTENTETFDEEEMLEEPTEMVEEEIIEEETTEMAEEESVEEKPTKMVQAKDEKKKEVKEKKLVSKTPKKSAVQTKKIKEQKAIQQKKALVKNLAKVMDKVDKDIKNISKNLQIKNIIKLQAMTSQQESLDQYQATSFYKPKDIYLDQLNLIDNRLIYADKSLATYIENDKIEIRARKLMEIKSKREKLLIELEVLKNG